MHACNWRATTILLVLKSVEQNLQSPVVMSSANEIIDLTDMEELDVVVELDGMTELDNMSDMASTAASAADLELITENRRLVDRIQYLEAEALGAWDREEELREQLRVAESQLTPSRRRRYEELVNLDCDFDGRERKFRRT